MGGGVQECPRTRGKKSFDFRSVEFAKKKGWLFPTGFFNEPFKRILTRMSQWNLTGGISLPNIPEL